MAKDIIRCTQCVTGSDVPGIRFDESGVCNFCRIHDRMDKQYPLNEKGKEQLESMIKKIKSKGKGEKYDCVVGVSGGTDSSYLLYLAVKKFGLRPVVVHFDNHWNSEIAEENMRKICEYLDVDLRVEKVSWEEFKDIQISFLKASVPEAEIPTDLAALKTQYMLADELGIKYILNGHSFRNEGMAPLAWSNMDGKYLLDVHKKYGTRKISSFPNLTLLDIINYTLVKGIKVVYLLDYVEYSKDGARKLMNKELGWTYYGGHHLESLYTRWVANYLLPVKFGIDKRFLQYSAQIRSGQITRETGMQKINEPMPNEEELTKKVIEKLELDPAELDGIMNEPIKSFKDYQTYYPLLKTTSSLVYYLSKTGLLGDLGLNFIEKYSTL